MRNAARWRRRARQSDQTTDLSDEMQLRAAYQAHGPELYRFALRQLDNGGAAQDAVQEIFMRAWRSSDQFDPHLASLRVWLFAIARNVVTDERRRDSRRPVPIDHSEPATKDRVVPGFDERVMDSWLVEEALQRIGTEHRTALVEIYLRGRSYAEVATEHGIPAGTLRSRVFYGLKALRVVMDEMGVRE